MSMNHHHHESDHNHLIDSPTVPAALTTSSPSPIDELVKSLDHPEHLHQHSHQHGHHSMKMFFHGGYHEFILFDFWRTETFFGLFLSLVVVFFMGVFYEGIKWFRVYFQLWTTATTKSSGCVSLSVTNRNKHPSGVEDVLIEKSALETNPQSVSCCDGISTSAGNTLSAQEVYAPTVLRSPPTGSTMPINRWIWLMMYMSRELSPSTCKLIETAIYIVQLLLAYWLMLITMTFNTYLTTAVVLGAGFGHWIFANIKCAPPRRCYCPACCNGAGGPEHVENFLEDACH